MDAFDSLKCFVFALTCRAAKRNLGVHGGPGQKEQVGPYIIDMYLLMII